MRKLLLAAPVLSFVLLVGYLAVGLTRDPSVIPTVLIDKPVPDFDLPAIEGLDDDFENGFSSADLRGEVSLVNIFGSWCVACLIEHPQLMAISAEGAVPIYGVDWKDEPGAGARWLARHGNPYTAIGDDADGRVSIDFGVTGAPETFVIDRKGRIRYKHIGPVTEQAWNEDILPIIEQVRDEG